MRQSFVPLVLFAVARAADAQPAELIAVASSDARFTSSLDATLASAGMSVVPVATWQPTVSDLTADARKLADDQHATATIALIAGTDETTLLAYDRAVDRALLRTLPYRPPLSEAQSAEVARMARAMLRALRVTPDVDLAPPRATEAAAVREQARVTAEPPPEPQLALELGAGVLVRAAGARALEHGSLAAVWRPDAIGAVLAIAGGPAADVAANGFAGAMSDVSIAASARVPLVIAPRWSVAGEAGLALHRFHLSGALDNGGIDLARYDPALQVAATVTVELRRGVAVGVAMSAETLLRYQDYTVAGMQVLDVPLARASVGIVLAVGIL